MTGRGIRRLMVLLAAWISLAACDVTETDTPTHRPTGDPQAPQELTLAVLPYISAPHLFDAFAPLADHLSERLNMPVRIKTTVNFDQFVRQTLRQRYDLVVSNPYLYLTLHARGGYEPLVADGRPFQSVLVVRRDSGLHTIPELQRIRIGVLPKGAFGGYLLPLDFLHSKGLLENRDFLLVEYSSFDLILTALLNGDIAVGGFWRPQYEGLSVDTKQQLRVIATTGEIVNDPYAVRSDLPPATKTAIRDALLALNDEPQRRELLQAIGVKNFVEVTDADYDSVRAFAARNKLAY